MKYFIGLISGTSMDGVDAALVEIGDTKNEFRLCDSLTYPYPIRLRQNLTAAIKPGYLSSVHDLAILDTEIALAFSSAATQLIAKAGVDPKNVTAIGSHGQTIRHSTESNPPYSVQLGNGPTIAAHTQIPVVNDFRSFDIASGGEGAPLVPAFHDWLFRDASMNRVILNIGGIANLTSLPADKNKNISGFDTGPGNCLLDDWCLKHLNKPFDEDGKWAGTGIADSSLLNFLLEDPYFSAPIPKSTGREYFNLDWLTTKLQLSAKNNLRPHDVQATLVELTVSSIRLHLEQLPQAGCEILVCGGGIENSYLMGRLQEALPQVDIGSTRKAGLDPEIVEACTFAWLAYCRWERIAITLTTSETNRPQILGALHLVS